MKNVFRIFGLVILEIFAIGCSITVFFFLAYLSDNLIVLCLGAILACFILSSFAGRLIYRRFTDKRKIGMFAGIITTVVFIIISYLSAFQTLESDMDLPADDPPESMLTIKSNTGSAIAYKELSSTDTTKPYPIVFLHSGPGAYVLADKNTSNWFNNFNGVGYKVVLYDQVGCGYSKRLDNVEQYTIKRHIEDLEAIRKLVGTDKMILIGESGGSLLAVRYMVEYPENVDKIVLMSPGILFPPEWDEKQPGNIMNALSEEQQLSINKLMMRPRFMTALLLSFINPSAAHNFMSDEEADKYFEVIYTKFFAGTVCNQENAPKEPLSSGKAGFWSSIMTSNSAATMTENPNESLSGNKTPVLILRGSCEYLVPEIAEQYLDISENTTLLEIPDAGHFLLLEQPAMVRSLIIMFLRGE